MDIIRSEIKEFESYLGFPIEKKDILLESNEPHDETFSYTLCQRFYGKNDDLKKAIKIADRILKKLLWEYKKDNSQVYLKDIETFYSLIGNMYYLLGDFKYAIGYFMKSLSYNKNDISNWVGLLFSLRSLGDFKLFEEGIFNFEKLCLAWRNDPEKEMTQKKVVGLIKK
ncbi:MAG: tetratricopeptide repeat protein [Candidatus Thorarchaeota archaeon]